MTKDRPDPRVNPDAQPWARANDAEQVDQNRQIAILTQQLQEARQSGGTRSDLIARLLFELQALYTSTGTVYPPGAADPAPAPPPDVAPAPVYKTITVVADWSRTWGSSSYYTGGGEYTNSTYLYQGDSGNKIGLWHFSIGEALNKNIIEASMFIANRNSAWSASFVAGFGTHGYVSAPVGKPGRVNGFDVGWSRGEGKWFPLPVWVRGGLSNGSIQGFSVGGIGASNANSAWFYGVGTGAPPVLGIKFQVN